MAANETFLAKLRETFKVEAGEHLQTMSRCLLELEKTSAASAQGKPAEARQKSVEAIFRAAHSLKGAARTVDFTEIESLCQLLEDIFARWKRSETTQSPEALDTLHAALDAARSMLTGTPGDHNPKNSPSLRQALRQLASPSVTVSSPGSTQHKVTEGSSDAQARKSSRKDTEIFSTIAEPDNTSVHPAVMDKTEKNVETVRVAISKLETRLLESEEMLMVKLIADQRAVDLRDLSLHFEGWRNELATIEPDIRKLRQSRERITEHGERRRSTGELNRLLDFVDWSVDYLKSLENRTTTLGQVADQDRHAVSKLVDDLLEDSKKLLLLPFGTISASLPKLVRDLCREQGKEADLVIQGDDIELDKQILEEMKDPLVHLLRNAVDHGIELPAERTEKGKPTRATIRLVVSQINGNKVQLLLSDDGAGIDSAKVKASALKLGLLATEHAEGLSETEAQALIFQSTVSTSPIITQLSGRGLGLAIVREKAEKLGGEVSVESRLGKGTDFLVTLPALRATFRGILVQSAGRVLVIPTAQVERVARIRLEDIQTVEGRETIILEGRVVSLALLADVLELPPTEARDTSAGMQVIVLGSGDQRIAFVVDAVLDEQEVLVKPLRRPLSRVRNIAATTVLGSGQVAPILNVSDLLKSARKATGVVGSVLAEMKSLPDETRTILVVEDSITSRMLLKGILESVGYKVKIAVDGMEGYTLLRTEKIDLVVSDVEMPRLNGFDLTARIRADKKLSAMPVVLVTALESREDRERGIDVGASAYLVKSNLDQSNLLEAVQRLI